MVHCCPSPTTRSAVEGRRTFFLYHQARRRSWRASIPKKQH
ncbi:unnamed protein product [Amoebophrya sp. A120]|nr:unnamed protein product [Amoebophrya sp. A120]|eukprot:GSA120T00022880001.1